jgi:hypothetical protein
MNARLLAEMIQIAVKKAVREEMQGFKNQIISEIRSSQNLIIDGRKASQMTKKYVDSNSLVENQKRFRQNYQVQPRQPNRRLANDPLLNELLQHTEPVPAEEAGYMGMFETEVGEINVPTSESGRPITSAPNAVLEAMNRNYSGMFATEEKKPVQVQPAPNSLRNSIVSRMEGLSGDMSFDDEEDIEGFLKSVH